MRQVTARRGAGPGGRVDAAGLTASCGVGRPLPTLGRRTRNLRDVRTNLTST